MLIFICVVILLTISVIQLWLANKYNAEDNIEPIEKLILLIREKKVTSKIIIIGFLIQVGAVFVIFSSVLFR